MSTLEKEFIEKLHQLQPAAKQRVRAIIDREVISDDAASGAVFDYAAWSHAVEALRQEIGISRKGEKAPIDVVSLPRVKWLGNF